MSARYTREGRTEDANVTALGRRWTLGGKLTDTADLSISEKAFQQSVVDLAGYAHWRVYHTLRSTGSSPGWPDLVLCRPPELLIVELKAEKGRVSDAQREWLDALAQSGVEVAVWRPSQWATVEARLTAPRPTPIAVAA